MRTPEGERQLEPGDVACFAAGPAGAHHVRNNDEKPARVAMISTKNEFGIAEYPESDKIGVWPGNPDDEVMLRRSDGAVDYFDGEL